MATTVAEVSLVTDGWTLIAENVSQVVVQMGGKGFAKVAVGLDDPGAGSDVGMMLEGGGADGGISLLPITGLESGIDEVWGRAVGTDEVVNVLMTT